MSKIFKVGSTIKYNADEIYSALDKNLDGFFVVSEAVENNQTAPEVMQSSSGVPMPPCKPVKAESPQQPTVPIQFVWHDGAITRKEYFLGMIGDPSKIENCTVEQIGAVLYVRSKGE